MKPAIDAMAVTAVRGGDPLPPEKDRLSLGPHELGGPYESRNLGDLFGLTQYGVMMETLAPGSRSSIRHWHTKSDEFVMVLQGELTLVANEGETLMKNGMFAGFPAGKANAHHLINRSDAEARFLVIGTRVPGDEVHYPHDDFQWAFNEDGTWYAAHKDGTPY
ncbi:cupin domain-containing protein [Parvibaculaceae bacterium PLY_AMNH_Bact1]|nr:cupin domain-containing protein [Parvibaculaceae bacterium PLY_AMNH_Bact1]